MPDSFFANSKPRKRKRDASSSSATTGGRASGGAGDIRPSKAPRKLGTSRKANGVDSSTGPSRPGRPGSSGPGSYGTGTHSMSKNRKRALDEELSDASDTNGGGDGTGMGAVDDMDLRQSSPSVNSADEDEYVDETPAEKRLRLAKLYLQGVEDEVRERDVGGWDAKDIDRDIIQERLKKDVAQQAGKVHLFLADTVDMDHARVHYTRRQRGPVTAAVASEDGKTLYTASKDGSISAYDLGTGSCSYTIYKARPAANVKGTSNGKGKGKGKKRADPNLEGHSDEIWALALSDDGKTLASAGKDRRIGVWDITPSTSDAKGKAKWRTALTGHRDGVTGIAYRHGTPTIYTSSLDRTLRIYSLIPGATGFVEALFGHQDSAQGVHALRNETCVSVGGRDKTARFWKVADETQLVFRGGGRSRLREVIEGGALDEGEGAAGIAVGKEQTKEKRYVEGSLECVAMIDEATFVSGGDSGSISLWRTDKKKPVFSMPLVHGLQETISGTEGVVKSPRAVLSLGALRYGDVFASGSYDGTIRLWKLDRGFRSFARLAEIDAIGVVNSIQIIRPPLAAAVGAGWQAGAEASTSASAGHDGEDADGEEEDSEDMLGGMFKSVDAADRTSSRRTISKIGKGTRANGEVPLVLIAAVAREPRLGRWLVMKEGVQNRAVVCVLPVLLAPLVLPGAP